MNNTTPSTKDHLIIGKNTNAPLEVYRMGYGTMRLTGEGIWGEPANRNEAVQVLKRAVQLGVNFIDTAVYYFPYF